MALFSPNNLILQKIRQGMKGTRPPFESLYIYALCTLIGFAIADLSVMSTRPHLLPKEPPPQQPPERRARPGQRASNLGVIISKNIMNADQKIPPALGQKEGEEDKDGPAQPSQLPIKLLGTIVHLNPSKSIATVNISSKNKTGSFKVDEEIEGMAKVTKIQRRKLTFRNLSNGRLEYVEIPEDMKITFGLKPEGPQTGEQRASNIQKDGDFEFTVDRSMIEEYTSNLSETLKSARVVPNFAPGSDRRVEGFRFVSIKPDSIFSKLGFKVGDTIKGVNGESVNSPTKAMEMYNTMKTSDEVNLTVERNGRDEEFHYMIE